MAVEFHCGGVRCAERGVRFSGGCLSTSRSTLETLRVSSALATGSGLCKRPSARQRSRGEQFVFRRCPANFPKFSHLACYFYAVPQCFFHCAPFQEDLERQVASSSISELDALPHHAVWVERFLTHTSFAGVAQENASECLMHILMAVGQGDMQCHVCGANAAS